MSDKWISVKDKLPEKNVNVLWYDLAFNEIFTYALSNPERHDGDLTHWMPIPEPPNV